MSDLEDLPAQTLIANRVLEFYMEPLPEHHHSHRLEIQATRDGLTFRELSPATRTVVRETSIPLEVIFNIWPLLQQVLAERRPR